MRLPIKIWVAAAILVVVAVLIFLSQPGDISQSKQMDRSPVESPTDASPGPSSPPREQAPPASTSTSTSTAPINMRIQFRQSRNYAEFVDRLSAAATAGDPVAEYLIARALKYCHDNAHWRVQTPGGSLRTRNELEIRIGRYAPGLRLVILDSYDRCQGFTQNGGEEDATSAWEGWLDKASAASYPPAQSMLADVTRTAQLVRDAASALTGDIIPPPTGATRDLAVDAALSGDPDSIVEMMNWVDGTHYSGDDYSALSSAWGLLACQRGYDGCGSTSEWLRSICTWDVQCANDNSVIDSLKRQFGSRFDDVQNLANEIGHAIDDRNRQSTHTFEDLNRHQLMRYNDTRGISNMSKIIYKVLKHDGGWAYEANGTYSEPFPTRETALGAAKLAASEQAAPGETTHISYEDEKGHWHDEVDSGEDRPETTVEG